MKFAIALWLFVIAICASAASAQHVKVIDPAQVEADTIRPKTFGGSILLTSDATVGLTIPAGKTLRFKAPKNRDGTTGAEIRSFYAFQGLGYSEPCDAGTSGPRIGSVRLTLKGEGSYNDTTYMWKTDPAWKGTCRVLVMKLRDGAEVRARVSFN